MKLRKAIRAKLGHMHFMKELKKVQFKRDVVGFNEAGKIGLLYDATDEKDYEVVKAYVKNVRGNLKKDILAMGYVDKCFPLQYIAAMSHARFRVGRYLRNATDSYDMMVQIKGEPAMKVVIDEIEHFLKQLKKAE